jgi:hypothetical protein
VIVVGAIGFVFWWTRRERAAEQALEPAAAGSASTTPAAVKPETFRRIDKPTRTAILDRIRTTRAARDGGTASTSSTPRPALPPTLPGQLTADDIRTGVRDLIPLLAECYDAALPRLTVKQGKITVKMHFIGEPDTGTLIDTATIEGDFTNDAELMECFQQTMLSIELPPTTAGDVDVMYPIAFSP